LNGKPLQSPPAPQLDSRAPKRLASRKMGTARRALLALLTVAFAAYGSDCLAMTTPEQAMRCCGSMHCSSHGRHGQDCCRTMGALHFPFVEASSGFGTFPSHVAIEVVPGAVEAPRLDLRAFNVALRCHAPPVPWILASPPIRI
jgi:hypothetical protein